MKRKITKPSIGDTRTVRKFAWLPTIIDQYIVWLETFETIERYIWTTGPKSTAILKWTEVRTWDVDSQRWKYTERKLLWFTI